MALRAFACVALWSDSIKPEKIRINKQNVKQEGTKYSQITMEPQRNYCIPKTLLVYLQKFYIYICWCLQHMTAPHGRL